MKKLILLFIVALLCSMLAGCKTKIMTSIYTDQHIKIDGDITEWDNIPVYQIEYPPIYMSLCNDEENLYVMLSFKNRQMVQWFQMTGVTLWLDNSGKKKKEFGVRLTDYMPLERTRRRDENINEERRPPGNQRFRKFMENRVDGLSFVTGEGEVILPTKRENEPFGDFKTSIGNQTLEFKIPIKKNNNNVIGLEVLSKGNVSIGFETGLDMSGGVDRMGEGGVGKRGGGRMGGRGGRMGENMDLSRSRQRIGKQEMWIKVRLSDKTIDTVEKK